MGRTIEHTSSIGRMFDPVGLGLRICRCPGRYLWRTPAGLLGQRALVWRARARRRAARRARRPRHGRGRRRAAPRCRIATPATIVGARSGCRPRTSRRSRERHLGEAREQQLDLGQLEHVAVHARAGRRARAPASIAASDVAVPATPTACATPARTSAGTPPRSSRGRRRRAAAARAAAAGRAVQVALGLAHDAGLQRDVEADRRSPRVPATSSVEPPPMSNTSSGVAVVGRRARASRRGRSAAASSSPVIVRASRPYVSRTVGGEVGAVGARRARRS